MSSRTTSTKGAKTNQPKGARGERTRKVRVATFIKKGGSYHAVNKRAHALARLVGRRSVMTREEVKQACAKRTNEFTKVTARVYKQVGSDKYAKSVALR